MKILFRCYMMLIVLISYQVIMSAQIKFRSGIFLHHSTGGCIWGPNGSSTSVPNEINIYNTSHGYTGNEAISLQEQGWPQTPWNNEWERWHRIFDKEDTIDADIRPFLLNHKIIIIKSCFPSSSMTDYGNPSDTLNPTDKTMYNYKWHWRNFIRVMNQHPENFFVIWTNAPLVAGATDNDAARLSDEFCRWAKDTLAKGLDPEFNSFPQNVYVFDFFHKLVGTDGKLRAQYAASDGDSHPNSAATQLVAPIFVQEVFDAAILYESKLTGVDNNDVNNPNMFCLFQNFPNPFNPTTAISYQLSTAGNVELNIYDLLGRKVSILINEVKSSGLYTVNWDASQLPSGVYFYRLTANGLSLVRKMQLIK